MTCTHVYQFIVKCTMKFRRNSLEPMATTGCGLAGYAARAPVSEVENQIRRWWIYPQMLHVWCMKNYIWVIFGVNVGKYSIHGASGYHKNQLLGISS